MFINGNLFMITSTRKLKFKNIENIPSQTAGQRSKGLNKVIQLYERGGFIIQVILKLMELEKLENNLGKVDGNISVAQDHMVEPEVERTIKTVKEQWIIIINTIT